MTAPAIPESALATLLLEAMRTHRRMAPPALLVPPDRDAAYSIQQDLLQRLNSPISAWKVGTAQTLGEVLGSPIPASSVQVISGSVRLADHEICGLELELAFRFGRSFPHRDMPYTDSEVLDALEAMAPAIEIVSSRYQGWPDLPDFLKLADLQNHGALIIGPSVPYRLDFPFLNPAIQLTVNGAECAKSPTGNPAGDPRHLLPAFVRQCVNRGLSIETGHWVTTGSYSGIYFAHAPGLVRGYFEGLPEVLLTLN
ncbi:MAG: 2-keto-4-pentenoate hydratase [Betaproteobacteria bacterium]|nr:2-keto-4-pentenoate hydratase [Betaproteobacteria bacterium]